MAKFPSAEWAGLFEAAVNGNEAYAEAAKGWEGDVLLRVLPEPEAVGPVAGIRLDLAHGACRSAAFVADTADVSTEFTFEGRRAVWERIVRGELDPVKAVLSNELKVRGNFAKAMRFTKASGLLVATARTVPTEF
jgi:putative sterol carrier protein